MEWFEAIFEIFGSAFLKKIKVKGGQGVKKWEFGKKTIFLKYQLFIIYNFVFMYYAHWWFNQDFSDMSLFYYKLKIVIIANNHIYITNVSQLFYIIEFVKKLSRLAYFT